MKRYWKYNNYYVWALLHLLIIPTIFFVTLIIISLKTIKEAFIYWKDEWLMELGSYKYPTRKRFYIARGIKK